MYTHTGTDWIQEVCTGQRKWCAAVVAAAIAVWVGVVQTKWVANLWSMCIYVHVCVYMCVFGFSNSFLYNFLPQLYTLSYCVWFLKLLLFSWYQSHNYFLILAKCRYYPWAWCVLCVFQWDKWGYSHRWVWSQLLLRVLAATRAHQPRDGRVYMWVLLWQLCLHALCSWCYF